MRPGPSRSHLRMLSLGYVLFFAITEEEVETHTNGCNQQHAT